MHPETPDVRAPRFDQEGGAESCGGMARAAAVDSECVVGAFFGGMRFQGLGEVVGIGNEP